MESSHSLLRAALREPDFRTAEAAFARWSLSADPAQVTELLAELDEPETRRLGHAIYVALAAGIIDAARFAHVTRSIADRVGIDTLYGVVGDIWRPDRSFEVERLRQRVEELRHASAA